MPCPDNRPTPYSVEEDAGSLSGSILPFPSFLPSLVPLAYVTKMGSLILMRPISPSPSRNKCSGRREIVLCNLSKWVFLAFSCLLVRYNNSAVALQACGDKDCMIDNISYEKVVTLLLA